MFGFKVLAGDLNAGDWVFSPKELKEVGAYPFQKGKQRVPYSEVEFMQPVDEEQKKKFLGALGSGIAGDFFVWSDRGCKWHAVWWPRTSSSIRVPAHRRA